MPSDRMLNGWRKPVVAAPAPAPKPVAAPAPVAASVPAPVPAPAQAPAVGSGLPANSPPSKLGPGAYGSLPWDGQSFVPNDILAAIGWTGPTLVVRDASTPMYVQVARLGLLRPDLIGRLVSAGFVTGRYASDGNIWTQYFKSGVPWGPVYYKPRGSELDGWGMATLALIVAVTTAGIGNALDAAAVGAGAEAGAGGAASAATAGSVDAFDLAAIDSIGSSSVVAETAGWSAFDAAAIDALPSSTGSASWAATAITDAAPAIDAFDAAAIDALPTAGAAEWSLPSLTDIVKGAQQIVTTVKQGAAVVGAITGAGAATGGAGVKAPPITTATGVTQQAAPWPVLLGVGALVYFLAS